MEEQSHSGVLLDVSSLTKCYKGDVKALDNIDLQVKPGEFVTIIGQSGAGKSTLLRCVNRLIEPSAGSIVFDGKEMCGLPKRDLRLARRRISMIFQHYNLVYRMTSVENVLHGRLGYKSTLAGALGLYSEEEKRMAFAALDQMDMGDFAYKRTDQLSGGQKQRVGIARALVQQPLLMLADEPIASLDPKSSRTVMERLRWAADELGIACLVNLHQVDFALEFSDRIVGLAKGKKVFDGTPDQVNEDVIRSVYGEVDIEGLPSSEQPSNVMRLVRGPESGAGLAAHTQDAGVA